MILALKIILATVCMVSMIYLIVYYDLILGCFKVTNIKRLFKKIMERDT